MNGKKILSLALGALLAVAALQARPNSAPRTVDLGGRWRFTLDRTSGETVPRRFPERVVLPGSTLTNGKGDRVTAETQWTGSLYDSSYFFRPDMARYRSGDDVKFPFFLTPKHHYTGNAWYSRKVRVPSRWRGRQVTLYLERPHIETTVYVNGKEVGHQMSLSVPHQYDITPLVRFGRRNTITIKVYNGIENVCVGQDSHSVTDQTQGNWNGIAGRIELQSRPVIRRLRVEPCVADRSARIFLNDTVYHVTLPPDAALWDEFNPVLHTVRLEYRGDTIPVTFGLREISTRGREILLNGRPVHLRGTVENCCFPETGYPPTDVESWERIFRICKEWGLNAMRFHSYCPPEAAFTAADRVGFYLQPEGPSWPNHGVRLRAGMPIDEYLAEECKAMVDLYGSHPSFVMLAAGNEPSGDWVAWGRDFVREMREYDPSRLYCTASVGGGWAWDDGSQYHVKGGARGLAWDNAAPQSTDDFAEQMRFPRNFRPSPGHPENDEPCISHEQGQWCAFPDLGETDQYTGVYKAGNFEIFRDLLRDHGMAEMAGDFLHASGRLQVLAYKYEMERHYRTPEYAGFQLLSLNDYSGQGTALVGALNVHWREKGYCTPEEWRAFCSETVPLAKFPRFTFREGEELRIPTALYNYGQMSFDRLGYTIGSGDGIVAEGSVAVGESVVFRPERSGRPRKMTLTLTAGDHGNRWDFWVYPEELPAAPAGNLPHITDTLDAKALDVLRGGGDVLLTAAGRIRFGNDVKHTYLPVFWNTSWFKMRPPHTTGAYIRADHPVFADFPTDDWQNLNWWELVNGAQVMNLSHFPKEYQPIVQPIDTWHLSRKLGMVAEARVLAGRLLITTLDISSDLDRRIVARQLRHSILRYMCGEDFRPAWTLEPETIAELFEHEADAVDMFTAANPDELKPKLN